jgi:hypothetical protein
VEYFHVVFTIPEALAPLALQNKKVIYDILFRAAAQTLLTIARDPKHLGAEIGFFAILHTWGQNLLHHPHLHCVVPGGGISADQTWVHCRPGFSLPVRVLSRLFRSLFLAELGKAFRQGLLSFHSDWACLNNEDEFSRALSPLHQLDWVVYAKPPFGGPNQVLEYLGRYTHRVAISNQRLVDCDDSSVWFRWKDYRHHNRQRVMRLSADEFLRRFLLHTLPGGFQRIRHYGIFANRHRRAAMDCCRQLLATSLTGLLPVPPQDLAAAVASTQLATFRVCPLCSIGSMCIVEILLPQPNRNNQPDSS